MWLIFCCFWWAGLLGHIFIGAVSTEKHRCGLLGMSLAFINGIKTHFLDAETFQTPSPKADQQGCNQGPYTGMK